MPTSLLPITYYLLTINYIPVPTASSMLQFAVGFVIYTKLPWREIKTKNGLQALTKAKQRKEASAKSISQRAQMGTPTSQSTS